MGEGKGSVVRTRNIRSLPSNRAMQRLLANGTVNAVGRGANAATTRARRRNMTGAQMFGGRS